MGSNSDTNIISISGNNEGSNCGYCKNLSGSKSYGIYCDNMKPETYFHFMNRGWRRCGTYFYKPLNEITCCPLYTIRCDTTNFLLSKSQRKVLKTFRKFLLNGKDVISKQKKTSQENPINARGDESNNTTTDKLKNPTLISSTVPPKTLDKSKKARTIRYNNRMEKIKRQSNGDEKLLAQLISLYKDRRRRRMDKYKSKSLREQLDFSSLHQPKHTLEVRTFRCHPEHSEFSTTKRAEHELYAKYQCSVHNDNPEDVTMKQFEQFLVQGGLHAGGGRGGGSIDLYGDLGKRRDRNLPQGQYHQQYWLDGLILVAVGVVDIAGRALSSVYLFYDPDYAFLNLGVFSALWEINFVDGLRQSFPSDDDDDDLRYYYMGFYAHTCPKMRYKAQYQGSMLLCPVAMTWVPVEACRDLLDRQKFARFSDAAVRDVAGVDHLSIQKLAETTNVVIGSGGGGGGTYRLKRYLAKLRPDFVRMLEQFARLVGSRLLSMVRIRL